MSISALSRGECGRHAQCENVTRLPEVAGRLGWAPGGFLAQHQAEECAGCSDADADGPA